MQRCSAISSTRSETSGQLRATGITVSEYRLDPSSLPSRLVVSFRSCLPHRECGAWDAPVLSTPRSALCGLSSCSSPNRTFQQNVIAPRGLHSSPCLQRQQALTETSLNLPPYCTKSFTIASTPNTHTTASCPKSSLPTPKWLTPSDATPPSRRR